MQINIFVNGNRDCWVVKWSGKKCILGNIFQVFFFCVLFAFLDYEICATDFPSTDIQWFRFVLLLKINEIAWRMDELVECEKERF